MIENLIFIRSIAMPRGRPSVAETILDHALRLFYAEGIRATGVDRVIAEAGVAGMSFYRNFKSKDGLVAAVLERRDRLWMDWFRGVVEAGDADPARRLLRVFDALGQWFARPDFHGCMFINAAGEFADADSTARRAAAGHKARLRAYMADLATQAGLEPGLGAMLFLLAEGAIVAAFVQGDKDAAALAGQAAQRLIFPDLRTKEAP
jgi:AcrR family transcriptional regulator